jgi:hypothetical protein
MPPKQSNSSRGNKRGSRTRSRTSITNLSYSEVIQHELKGGVTTPIQVMVIPTNFSWLKGTAQTFSKYQLKKVVFTFLPAGSMTYTGQIVGAFTYDAFENQPSSFAHVAQTSAHRIQTVHKPQSWTLDVSKTLNQTYPVIDAKQLQDLPNQQKIPYLPAVFHLANTSPNTQTLGILQCTYSVDFSAPLFLEGQNTQPLGLNALTSEDNVNE